MSEWKLFSRVQLCDPMDCSPQAPLYMEFSRQEYWSGLSFLSLGDLPNPGIKLWSPTLQAYSLPLEPPRKPLTILSSLTNKHERFFHLLSSSLIYFFLILFLNFTILYWFCIYRNESATGIHVFLSNVLL